MAQKHRLGDLQLDIMQVLWQHGEAAVTDVQAALPRELAPTTVATMLKKMEDKGVVRHRTEGRRFLYQPTVSEDAVCRSMVGTLMNQLFEGNPAALVNHLLSEHEIDPEELRHLRAQLERLEEDQ